MADKALLIEQLKLLVSSIHFAMEGIDLQTASHNVILLAQKLKDAGAQEVATQHTQVVCDEDGTHGENVTNGGHPQVPTAETVDMEEQDGRARSVTEQPSKKQKKEKGDRQFDFSRYKQRYVALEVMYIGWDMQGFARQEDTENTVEGHFFRALKRVKLIPEDTPISSLQYSRCGRTDKGVSALGQVVALLLRSNARVDGPEISEDNELDYPRILNRVLPDDIRVLGWTPVGPDFSARFSCRHRQYKYFIVQSGNLDLAAMQQAASHFVGDHDFRNFCKPDIGAVRSFRRTIISFTIEPVGAAVGGHQAYALVVKGTAFLWHQVRCMAAVLLMVGRGRESPDVVARLLDVEAMPGKPQYNMAPEEPLLLHACEFEELSFRRTPKLISENLDALTCKLHKHIIGAAMAHTIMERITADCQQLPSSMDMSDRRSKASHIPLLKRQKEPSIEERLKKHNLKMDAITKEEAEAMAE